MRTFHIAALAILAAVSESVVTHAPGMMESFDTSILNARSGLPNTVPMVARANIDNSSVKVQKRGEMVRVTKKRDESTVALAADVQKRGEEQTEEECEADEDDNTDSDEEDCEEDDDSEGEDEDCEEEETSNNDKPAELPTSSIRNAAAVVPTSTSTITSPSTAAPAKPAADGPIQKPSNIADESFTPSEGCIRYHTVLEGEVCLGVLDGSKDLGLTLDQFYCLNPGIKEGCSNLTTGKAYCTGYSGEWPQ